MIQFRAVTKKYKNDNYALKNVNLDIMSGEFVFIVGASGAGKSTLMKLLYNEERPTSGTVTIGGINIANLSNDKIPNLRRCMGIVFQDYKLLQNQSVYDNVAYVIRTLGISSREINARVSKILNDLRGKLNTQLLSEFRSKVQSSVEANAKSIDVKLASLGGNVDETLQMAGADYIKQLELELKDKEATEKKISRALSTLEQFKKSF